jgi:hypothetical protein
LGSVARHGCFVQFHDWFLVSLALICYHRRKELDGAVRLRASDDVGDRGGKGGSTLEGLGFGAGQRMVSAVGSGQLKARGSPSQGPLFRSHVFAVLFPAHRCRFSPFPCISAYGRGWEELGSARGDSELADR